MKPLIFVTGLLAAVSALPAHAQTFTISNPSDAARTDAVAEVPVKSHAKAWSVRIGGQVFPAQYLDGRVRFLVSLAPKESVTAEVQPLAAPKSSPRVLVTLNVQDGGKLVGDPANGGAIKGGVFHLKTSFTPPKSHFIHDGLIAFEGIGWESDRVMYRLYLDERNVPDLFGKYGTGMIYPDIGHGFDDYQYPRAWGGDIYKVGNALGMGGLGFLRDGKAVQTGPSTITGRVAANGPVTAVAGVDADALGGGKASLHATYAISAGDTLTHVDAVAKGTSEPLVAGLTVHPGDTVITPQGSAGEWSYVAVWGKQEHDQDEVGTVLFYRPSTVQGEPTNDSQTLFVTFTSPTEAHYAFAGRWVYENKNVAGNRAVKDIDAFRAWVAAEASELAQPLLVSRK